MRWLNKIKKRGKIILIKFKKRKMKMNNQMMKKKTWTSRNKAPAFEGPKSNSVSSAGESSN